MPDALNVKPPGVATLMNPRAPRADRIKFLYAIDGTTGTTAQDNLGHADTVGNALSYEDWGAEKAEVASIAMIGTAWATGDPDDRFGNNLMGLNVIPYSGTTDPVFFHRGTIMMRILEDEADTTLHDILTCSGASANFSLRIIKRGNTGVSADQCRIQLTDDLGTNTDRRMDISDVWPADAGPTWATIVVRFGEGGFRGDIHNGIELFSASASTDTAAYKIAIENGTNMALNPGAIIQGVSSFCFWDIELTDDEVHKVVTDAAILFRPRTSTNFLFPTNPMMTRPVVTDTTSVTFNMPTGGTTSGTSMYRVNIRAADTGGAWTQYPTVPVNATNSATAGAIYQRNLVVVTGLANNTDYEWVAEWSDDSGANYYPCRGGLGYFNTTQDTIAFWTDDHTVNNNDSTNDLVPEADDPLTWLDDHVGTEVGTRKLYAAWSTGRDIAQWRPHMQVHGGDSIFGDGSSVINVVSDQPALFYDRIAAWTDYHWQQLSVAPIHFVWGNHDGMAGYYQNAEGGQTNSSCQKQSTIAAVRCCLNPDHTTYNTGQLGVASGENEGIPETDNALDWMRGVTEEDGVGNAEAYNAAYRNKHIIDTLSVGARNRSPLLNYWAQPFGKTLLVALDPYRYANPADNIAQVELGGTHLRTNETPWELKDAQHAWLDAVLATTWSHLNGLCFWHNGGGITTGVTSDDANGNYGRGVGDSSDPEDIVVRDKLRQAGFNGLLRGHDHTGEHAIVNTLNVLTGPTCGSPSQTGDNGGWHFDQMVDDRGQSENLGRFKSNGTTATDASIIKHFNILGYWRLSGLSGATITAKLRQTSVSMLVDHTTPTHETEHWCGPVYTTDGSGNIDLTSPKADQAYNNVLDYDTVAGEVPRHVVAVYLVSDLDEAATIGGDVGWWDVDNTPTNKRTTRIGHIEQDEALTSATIAGGAGNSVDVVVHYYPRTIYSITLAAAVPVPTAAPPGRSSETIVTNRRYLGRQSPISTVNIEYTDAGATITNLGRSDQIVRTTSVTNLDASEIDKNVSSINKTRRGATIRRTSTVPITKTDRGAIVDNS